MWASPCSLLVDCWPFVDLVMIMLMRKDDLSASGVVESNSCFSKLVSLDIVTSQLQLYYWNLSGFLALDMETLLLGLVVWK